MEQFPKLEEFESEESEESDLENKEFPPMYVNFPNSFIEHMFNRDNWVAGQSDYGGGGQGLIYLTNNFTVISYWIEETNTCFTIINTLWNFNLKYKIELPTDFSLTEENIISIDSFLSNIEELLNKKTDKSTKIPTLNGYQCIGEWK